MAAEQVWKSAEERIHLLLPSIFQTHDEISFMNKSWIIEINIYWIYRYIELHSEVSSRKLFGFCQHLLDECLMSSGFWYMLWCLFCAVLILSCIFRSSYLAQFGIENLIWINLNILENFPRENYF
jgi:hypothetical protein